MTSRQPDEFTSRLLRAARAERPDSAARSRALAAASFVAAGAASTGGIASKVTLTKQFSFWLSAMVLAAAGVVAVVESSRASSNVTSEANGESGAVDSYPAERTVLPLVPRSAPVVEQVAAATTSTPAAQRAVVGAPSTALAMESRESRPSELTLIRSAKRALSLRAPADALATLDEHADLYPKGALDEEAEALRVVALAELGEASARACAERFASSYPDSPYAQRVASAVAKLPR